MAHPQEFAFQVAEHMEPALRFAIRLTGDVCQAEDLLQDAFLKATRAWPEFRGQSAFKTWFWRIVINAFRDHHRQKQPLASLPEDALDSRSDDPADLACANELGAMVAQEVSSLPPRQREVLVLITYEGFSVADAAASLDMTPANIYATLNQARNRLKQRLLPILTNRPG